MAHPDYRHIGTPADRCIEELSELIQAICKAQRFGLHDAHPETGITNYSQILYEMADVYATMEEYLRFIQGETK